MFRHRVHTVGRAGRAAARAGALGAACVLGVAAVAAAPQQPGAARPAALPPPPAAPFIGRPVSAIALSIEGIPTQEPSLAETIQTQLKSPLSMIDVRETIAHLYALGRFEDVRVSASAADGGVALRYELMPVHTVIKVEFKGTLGLPEGLLRSRMTERFGPTPPLSRASDVAVALEDLYHESGYLGASVKPVSPILEHEPHRAILVFEVTAGVRTTIATATVSGHPLEPVDKVRERLQIVPGQPYQSGDLQKRLADYVTWMRRGGHYEAKAREERPIFDADRASVDLTVNVEPGPIVEVQYEGDPLPKDKTSELVPIEREGSVDQDLLEDAARRIKDYLNKEGYWKADIKPPERRERDGRLVLVFHITRGAQYRVAPPGVEISGNRSVSFDELRPLLKPQTAGEPFVESTLSAIGSAIRQLYLTKGFARVEMTSQANEVGPGLIKPAIAVKEGPRLTVGQVTMSGNRGLSTGALTAKIALTRGDPYYGPNVARAREAIRTAYQNAGWASATVTATPRIVSTSEASAVADIPFEVNEGPRTIVEHIFVTGNLKTKPDVVLNELRFHEAAPLGQEDVTETRRRLSALGLFRRIQISTISHGDPSRTDVVVNVEEAPPTTISYGGGLQIDRILKASTPGGTATEQYEVAPRGFFEIGRRNVGGTNRSVDLYTRLSLRPSTNPSNTNPFGFSEYRVIGTYREPRALRNYGDLTATAAVEQGVRSGFNFSRKGLNAEITHRLSRQIRGSARYSLGTTRIFDLDPTRIDASAIDRVFPQVRLSAFSGAVSRDTRDDLLEPQRGTFLAADGTIAARAVGSEVGYGKTFLQGFVYRNLGKPRLVFAGGARLGVARGFPRLTTLVDQNGVESTITVRDLPASERFYAGGDTTIRGYALDSVGVPSTITSKGLPLGGDAEVVLNAELRTPIKGPVGGVVFIDGGNVFQRTADLDFSRLLGSVGTGLRVKTPVGPVRFDIGFKLARRVVGGVREPGYAVHFSIGQAF